MDDLAYHMARGRAYLNNYDFLSAAQEFFQAIDLDPSHLNAYICRALATIECDDPKLSTADYETILRLDPDFAEAAFAKAKLRMNSILQRPRLELPELYVEAISLYSRAIEHDPYFLYAYDERASLHLELGNLREAVSDFTKCIELDPNFAIAYAERARIYGKMGLYPAAIRDLETYLRLPAGAGRNKHEMEEIAYYWRRLSEL